MSITATTEKQFESDIEAFLISAEGGYTKGIGTYNPKLGLYPDKLISFIQRTQPREWTAFERQNDIDPVRKFWLLLTMLAIWTECCMFCD